MMIIQSVFSLLTLSSLVNGFLFEGQNCTTENNDEGQCIKFDDCEDAKQLLKENKRPQTCGFKGNMPLVCCPKVYQVKLPPGYISHQKCRKYYDPKYRFFAIDLGQKALSKEFPHMAAVGYGQEKANIVWLCGGTLISHHFVLSAAHCVESSDFGPAKWIRLGDLDLKNTTEDANPLDSEIIKVYVHPEYKPSSHYHDIALFKMEKVTHFGIYFKPACLQMIKSLPVKVLGVTGWGRQGFFGESSSHLLKADLNLVDHSTCAKKYATVANTRKLKNGILDEYQICAGDDEGRDTCPGDSGGPLHYFKNGDENVDPHFVVAGITSFGKGCGGGNTAGVYTRVSAYVEWIENIVWKEDE